MFSASLSITSCPGTNASASNARTHDDAVLAARRNDVGRALIDEFQNTL